MPRLLVIDNYDSFTYNLVQMFMRYALDIQVFRSDALTLPEAHALAPDYILVSPGPKDPSQAGISVPLIKAFYRQTPILGVCLGMQSINEAFGGRTIRAFLPMHGKTSLVRHEEQGLFKGVPSPFPAARYHSLVVDRIDPVLAITAQAEDGVIMGISHKQFPTHGVQFHPESFLTEHGLKLIENFLGIGPPVKIGRTQPTPGRMHRAC